MYTAEALVKLLEKAGVSHIFGHPGEQILKFYQALANSSIKHILVRHEQAAAHAADGFARSSGKFGVCISTASPGALNFVMAVATAYKDSVPILVLTGDNPTSERSKDTFQSFDLSSIFKEITIKNFSPKNGCEAILNMKEAIKTLKNHPRGPIHINLSKDVLNDENIKGELDKKFNISFDYDYSNIDKALKSLESSKRPLILVGNGVLWSGACDKLKDFIYKNNIPVSTTYHGRGIISEEDKLNLGLTGIRGTSQSNYAYLNSDLILSLGCKLSERTTYLGDFNKIKNKIIDVNINKNHLKGKIQIYGDIKTFLEKIEDVKLNISNNWLDDIFKNDNELKVEGVTDESLPLRPQLAIKSIFDKSKDSFITGDAGSHTTWSMIFAKPDKAGKFIFSGGLGPMGWGLPAAIGVSYANPDKNVIVINGDGGFQMSIQELATIYENNLPITICILNNSQLGIIRQWESLLDEEFRYQVDLKNPDFLAIAKSYGIDGKKVYNKDELFNEISKSNKLDSPYIIEIIVREEDIPLPNNF